MRNEQEYFSELYKFEKIQKNIDLILRNIETIF